MVLFHTIFDLTDFFGYSFDYMQGLWYYQGKSAAVLFMLVSGVSCTLGRHNIKRGLIVLSAGAAIIMATYFFNSATYVRFGILQLLGCSMLSYSLLKPFSPLLLSLMAGAVLLVTHYLSNLTGAWYLLPFGITPLNFASIDYYPLFPWYAVFLAGTAFGKFFYAQRQPLLPNLPHSRLLSYIEYSGRHSLLIYLVHQPVLLALLYGFHRAIR
jgi:uncharacterized membrane protein